MPKSGYLVLFPALFLVSCGGTPTDNHPGQPVTKRKAAFNRMLQSMEQIGLMARGRQEYQATAFLNQARELRELAKEPWQYFTPDSNYPPTRAKADLWDHRANFDEFAKELGESIDKLVQAAEVGKYEAVVPAYQSVEDSCQACHKRFRKTAQ